MSVNFQRMVEHPFDSEQGQSHILGFAICLPIVLIALFFLTGLSWIGWQSVSIDHALYQTSWTMDAASLDRALTSGKHNEVVSDMIAADWTMLDEGSLAVHNASISSITTQESQELTDKGDHENMRIERAGSNARYANISADVSYTVKLPFALPEIESVTLTRHIDKTQQITSRFEVS